MHDTRLAARRLRSFFLSRADSEGKAPSSPNPPSMNGAGCGPLVDNNMSVANLVNLRLLEGHSHWDMPDITTFISGMRAITHTRTHTHTHTHSV